MAREGARRLTAPAVTSEPRPKREWSAERREKQRQLAKKLHAEGVFGGANTKGKSGRPHKRAPSPSQLSQILERATDRRGVSSEEAHFLTAARVLAKLAPHVGHDREHMEHLLIGAVHSLRTDGLLPELARVRGHGVVEFFHGSSRGETNRLRDKLVSEGEDGVVVLREFAAPDARRLSDPELVECLGAVGVLIARPLLQGSIRSAIHEMLMKVMPSVQVELDKRGLTKDDELEEVNEIDKHEAPERKLLQGEGRGHVAHDPERRAERDQRPPIPRP